MRAKEFDPRSQLDPNSRSAIHSQLLRWAMHDQDQRDHKFKPFLMKHAAELAKDGSKANVMRLWYGTDKVDASRHFDPMQDQRWHGTAKRFIRDNIDTILGDPGGWTSQRDGHDVVLAHIIVQHMDDDPAFQEWFLQQMQSDPNVAKANAEQIRYLSDRVEVNKSGYWNRPDAGLDPTTIPHGSHGTQGNRYSMDHSRKQELDEANLTTNILVVDVQPAYDRWCGKVAPGICELLNRHRGKKYVLFNAQDVGVEDSESQVAEYLYEHGLDYDIMMDGVEYFEKSYGYFRSWMDQGVPVSALIKVIRAMVIQRKHYSDELDLHQLFDGNEYHTAFTMHKVDPEREPIYMPDFMGIAKLRQMQPFLMCGGGRNECLREIEILCHAFNIRYKRIDSLIY